MVKNRYFYVIACILILVISTQGVTIWMIVRERSSKTRMMDATSDQLSEISKQFAQLRKETASASRGIYRVGSDLSEASDRLSSLESEVFDALSVISDHLSRQDDNVSALSENLELVVGMIDDMDNSVDDQHSEILTQVIQNYRKLDAPDFALTESESPWQKLERESVLNSLSRRQEELTSLISQFRYSLDKIDRDIQSLDADLQSIKSSLLFR